MISYLKSLTLRQRANGILGLTALLYCFAFVGQFFFGSESWYQPLYWAVQSALIGSVADWFAVTALFVSHSVSHTIRRSFQEIKIALSMVLLSWLRRRC